jgi:hypothetical protein
MLYFYTTLARGTTARLAGAAARSFLAQVHPDAYLSPIIHIKGNPS